MNAIKNNNSKVRTSTRRFYINHNVVETYPLSMALLIKLVKTKHTSDIESLFS